jgi:Zn-dependent protease with chaperone function
MSKARAVICLLGGLALLGAGVTAVALFAAARSVRWDVPSAAALIEACQSFALPQLTTMSVLTLLLGSGAFAVLALAGRSVVRQTRASRRFLAGLQIIGPAPCGLPSTFVFADEAPQAFCAGLLRPRIFVSTGAIAALADDELQAVLAHERHHAGCRDPLRLLLARTASDALFFLPGMRQLADRYAALAELAADRAAVRANGGDRRSLAAALLAFDAATSTAVVGIAPERVDSLLGDRPAWQLPLALVASALVVLTAIAGVAVRVAEASAHTALNLPLLLANACMLAMATVPLAVGAAALLGSRRALRHRGMRAG